MFFGKFFLILERFLPTAIGKYFCSVIDNCFLFGELILLRSTFVKSLELIFSGSLDKILKIFSVELKGIVPSSNFDSSAMSKLSFCCK